MTHTEHVPLANAPFASAGVNAPIGSEKAQLPPSGQAAFVTAFTVKIPPVSLFCGQFTGILPHGFLHLPSSSRACARVSVRGCVKVAPAVYW